MTSQSYDMESVWEGAYIYHKFVYTTDGNGAQNHYGMIQYYFDGPEVEIKIKPHGNSKLASPFFRTSESAKKHSQRAGCHQYAKRGCLSSYTHARW